MYIPSLEDRKIGAQQKQNSINSLLNMYDLLTCAINLNLDTFANKSSLV